MSLGARLARTRIVSEVKFALGGALIGAAAGSVPGLLAAIAAPPPTKMEPWVAAVIATARGIGFGWWGGLLWSIALAILARRASPPPPVAMLLRSAWVAATATVLGALLAHVLSQPLVRGVLGGVIVGSLAAGCLLARARTSSQP